MNKRYIVMSLLDKQKRKKKIISIWLVDLIKRFRVTRADQTFI